MHDDRINISYCYVFNGWTDLLQNPLVMKV